MGKIKRVISRERRNGSSSSMRHSTGNREMDPRTVQGKFGTDCLQTKNTSSQYMVVLAGFVLWDFTKAVC